MRAPRSLPALAVAVILGLGITAGARADEGDWAQWLGPSRDGNVPGEVFAKWPKVKLKPRWSKGVGNGYATAVATDDRVYTMGYNKGNDIVVCFDAKKGKAIWQYGYPCKIYDNMNAGGPSGTPSLADGRLFTISREAQLHAFDAKKGKVLWNADLGSQLGARVPQWGFSGSPLVLGNAVIVDVGVIAAFDVKTGKAIWKTTNYGAGYSSPVAFERDGKKFIAVFPARGLIILNPSDGNQVASFNWKTDYDVNAATPLVSEDGSEIFISSGYNTGCALVKFDGKTLTEAWRNKNMRNHMATCVRVGDYIYGIDDAVLRCLRVSDGKTMWSERASGKGALIRAGDKLIVLSDGGDLMMAPASEKGFKPVLKKKVLRARGCWSAPVMAHGRLFCRSPQGELVCIEIE